MSSSPTGPILNHDSLRGAVPAVLGAWGIDAAMSIAPVAGGTLNWNFDVRTDEGRFFLRCYRSNLETERIEGEHELLRWAAERGIPVAVPLKTGAGATIVVAGGERWALFPWLPGKVVERGALSAGQAYALGAMHGRLQAALAGHPDSTGATMLMRWDKAQSLGLLAQLITTARERGLDDAAIAGMERQREFLERLDVLPPESFVSLPAQILHGDFHDQQVLFDGDVVTGVVDWEIWHTDPRAWEVMRSLSFSRLLDSPRLDNYLAGYREHVALGEDEVRLALRLWFQSRLVGVWVWWAYVMEGNARVAEFFPATLAELELVSDPSWAAEIESRVLRAACG